MERLQDQERDVILWKKVQQKADIPAFNCLYAKYVSGLFDYGMSLCRNEPLVKDCVQDLFITLWKNRTSLRIDLSLRRYLYISLRRLVMRKMKRETELLLTELPPESSERPGREATKTFFPKTQLSDLLKALPRRQREAIRLKYFDNLDYEEIAQVMGVEKHSVYKLVSRGIRRMRKFSLPRHKKSAAAK